MPEDLAALVTTLYAGGHLAASKDVVEDLRRRKIPRRKVVADGSVGSWKGTPVAVVTSGDDVTLAVKQGGEGATSGWQVVGGWWPSLQVKAPHLGGNRRVLLIGSDARVSKGQKVDRSRADSLHVVGLDGRGGGGLLGIPRDAWVPLSTGGKGKINSAMALAGPTAELQTVRLATGLPIEGYLLTGFGGFTDAVGSLGGLLLDAPRAVIDPSGHNSGADVKKGTQRLTGKEALAYARERKSLPDGDFGRSRNQGLVLLAGGAMARLAGPSKLPAMLDQIDADVSTDLSAAQVLTLAASVFVVHPTTVHNRVATGGFGTSSDGQSIVVLGDTARGLFADLSDGNLS